MPTGLDNLRRIVVFMQTRRFARPTSMIFSSGTTGLRADSSFRQETRIARFSV